ncbi:LysR substrate-binding domain-containing protein [Fulvimarina sp. 2208YS6-2-32]|uniref:LysR substrate-binding domain-containing protein n=2 Tax=Fulvimarina uroteuthidis TaxID=3098149 RepID=A0ABU5I4J5_9HYPH|nr:LysR substrate-binding domain-containing protein [Fulvimarina sp. 2208YS6-2-32]
MTFDAVVRLRSMQAAADELNVTPPAITQAIKSLEGHVGVELLDRRSRPSRPTDAGERLAWATREGLERIAGTIADIRVSAGLSDRHLTVSCTIGMATYWLMPRLPDFYARHPDVSVNVQAPPSDLPTLSNGIDVALRYGSTPWSDGRTERLFAEITGPVGKGGLIASIASDHGRLVTAPLIHVRASAGRRWLGWEDYFAARGLPAHRGPTQSFDNYIQAVQAAQDGRGLMLGWKSITRRLVRENQLDELPGGAIDFGMSYFVTCAKASERKPIVESFVAWLLAMGKAED